MDIELARTFLVVLEAGNFVGAANRLHLSQPAISRRIKSLESALGCSLFVRNKAGAVLTPAGKRFQKHAALLLRTFEQARQEVGTAHGFHGTLTVGARFGLWEGLLLPWLAAMRLGCPDVALRALVGFEEGLMQQLVDGSVDLGIMYTPQSRPGLSVEALLEEELILVRSGEPRALARVDDYVRVDWGPEFQARLNLNHPEYASSGLSVAIGWLGLQHILEHGGSGHFPERLVRSHLEEGTLQRVVGAPSFRLPAYAVYATERDDAVLDPALRTMRTLAAGVTQSDG